MQYDGEILQVVKDGIKIEEFLNQEFLDSLKEKFDEFDAIPIGISIVLEKNGLTNDTITLTHHSKEYVEKNKIVVDVNDSNNLERILEVLKEM